MTSTAVSRGLVEERARALVRRGRERLLLIGSAPTWSGPESFVVEGQTVHVVAAVSQLAALSAYADLTEDEYLVVLTDRPERDLGDALLVRAYGRGVERPDDWDAVAAMTGAHSIDPELRKLGRWAASALLDHRPPNGWPTAITGILTKDEAVAWVLAKILGSEPAPWDSVRLLEVLASSRARTAWSEADETLRRRLIDWSTDTIGPQARLGLLAAASTPVSVVAIGLAMDVLWPGGEPAELQPGQIAARARLERFVGNTSIQSEDARALARDTRDIAIRMDDSGDPDFASALTQAEKLLSDVGWQSGARNSDILTAGFAARLESFATRLSEHLVHTSAASEVEKALAKVSAHRLSQRESHEVNAAVMATRLVRWLSSPAEEARTLAESLQQQVDDGGWVDRAIAAIWTGSGHGAVSAAYRELAGRVLETRADRDRIASAYLARETSASDEPDGFVPVEQLVRTIVRPLARERVLLLVLDGMSMRVATEIAQGAIERGWSELLPGLVPARIPGLAALPTVTKFSRTSLLCGELRDGSASTEKQGFREVAGGPVFHKDDLRSGPGDLLPEPVQRAIADPGVKVVGAVLNTIDDALSKDEPDSITWDLDRIPNLRALLNAAALAGRIVVLTSDHGHVVERGGTRRPFERADARWRPIGSGPVLADEVVVSGPRVLSPGNEAILAVHEGLRYGMKSAGYHGGASLAEITVPIIVLDRAARSLKGWRTAQPQTPPWWNEPITDSKVEVDLAFQERRRVRRAPKPDVNSFDALLPELTQTPSAEPATDSLVQRLLSSDVYAAQRARAGRRALGDDEVGSILGVLIEQGGRAHRETVATAAGVAVADLGPRLVALRRLLNVEGYAVVGEDPDGVTVVLDEKLLIEQFELGK